MKKILKEMIAGTFLETIATRARTAFSSDVSLNCKYDMQTVDVMSRLLKENSNCIDVGCHQGSILKDMLRFAPKGNHFAFEPLPDMYRDLLKSFAAFPNIRIFDLALSDAEGETSFQHVVSNPGYSGLRRRSYDRPNEEIKEIVVKTAVLDRCILDSVSIDFIKVDVEGAELQVFRGGIKVIKRDRPVIVFEHGLGAADHYGTSPDDIYDLIVGECGLRISLMADWLESSGTCPLTRMSFSEQFWTEQNYYFMAHP